VRNGRKGKTSLVITVTLLVALIIWTQFPIADADYSNLVETVPMEHGYIRSDGTIEPSTLPIERTGNFYKLKDNIKNYTIEIQKSNIIFDGNGFSLSLPQQVYTLMPGKYGPALIQINGRINVGVQNTTFSTYFQAISVTNSSKIMILSNNFTNGRSSIALRSCSYCDVFCNNLETSNGLSAIDSTNLNIAYNNITRSQQIGCLLQGVTYSNITRNNIVDTSIGDSSGSGLYITAASNNRFFENNFIGNPNAIYFSGYYLPNSSVNNLIYRNYFHENHKDILNIGGDVTSGINQFPLESPAFTSFQPRFCTPVPPENSTTTESNKNYNPETIVIISSSIIIASLLVAGFWLYLRRYAGKYGVKTLFIIN
jgi:hypothetical protein